MKKTVPIFIDIEASSLGIESYPIEIAWNDGHGVITSWLINPDLYPENWRDWDPGAEAVHGLSRQFLVTHGEKLEIIARNMIDRLPRVLYSDAPDFDAFWLDRLFEAAGLSHRFIVKDATVLLSRLNPEYAMMEKQAREMAGKMHRAGNDVAFLVALYQLSS